MKAIRDMLKPPTANAPPVPVGNSGVTVPVDVPSELDRIAAMTSSINEFIDALPEGAVTEENRQTILEAMAKKFGAQAVEQWLAQPQTTAEISTPEFKQPGSHPQNVRRKRVGAKPVKVQGYDETASY